jgi:transposase-like protein
VHEVQKRAFYIAIGVGLDGKRDVLGIWAPESEGAKYLLGISTSCAIAACRTFVSSALMA